jgi:riboflavin kinase/FMN adenylyltransferase
MFVFRHYLSVPPTARRAVVALGNFDGVHRGHQIVIGQAREIAQAASLPSGVVTFEPHPRSLFRPQDPPFRLTPFRVKAHCIAALGVDYLYSLPFTRALAGQSAEEFLSEVLLIGLGVSHAVVGWDFVFGKGRDGNAEILAAFARKHGIGATIVEPVTAAGETVSATRIREALAVGDVAVASRLLGHNWEIDGRVTSGDRRGRTIGFPTANLPIADYIHPCAGVYAVKVGVESGADVEWHGGVANIGARPTVGGTEFRVEAHLFDFAGDLYGRRLRVALVDFLRAEQKFSGIEALKAQIALDAAKAREILTA